MECSEPIGVVGTGRLAQALGRLLRERGEPVACVAGRDVRRTRAAAEFIGGDVAPVGYEELARRASRFLIAVSDGALGPVVQMLSTSAAPGGIALHTCGAKELAEFAPLAQIGFSCGTLHPLQTIADPLQGTTALPGAFFAVSGDGRAMEWARRIAESLGGRTVGIVPGVRPLYHAAAVMASNYVVALLDAAQELMAMATDGGTDAALRALAPLARAALENALAKGPAAALTGPIERGDTGTVALHLGALTVVPERIRALYCAGGLQALDLARRKGLPDGTAADMEILLKERVQ